MSEEDRNSGDRVIHSDSISIRGTSPKVTPPKPKGTGKPSGKQAIPPRHAHEPAEQPVEPPAPLSDSDSRC